MASIIVTALTFIVVNTRLAECGQAGVQPTSTIATTTTGAAIPIGSPSTSCALGKGWQSYQVVNDTSAGTWPYQVFQSSPFHPPNLEITRNGQPLAPGLLVFAPWQIPGENATKQSAPLIMTDEGQLVWNGENNITSNFRVATYQNASILTFWTGNVTSDAYSGHGYGNVTFLDTSYNEILTVCPQFGLVTPDGSKPQCEADLHESFVTDRGTLLVTAYNITQADLSSVGGPVNGWIGNSLFYELDPKDGKILFRWSAIEHVPVSQTKFPLAGQGFNQSAPFDYFHINSVVNIGKDGYLIGSRHLWTTYLLNATGDIDCAFQGDTGGDFGTVPENGKFSWQHHVRPTSITLTIFNNAAAFPDINGTTPSTGLRLQLPLPPSKSHPPLVLDQLTDPADPLSAGTQGSVQSLPNHNILMGYGQIPVLKEYGPADPTTGNLVRYSARFGPDVAVESYRAFKSEWHGRPGGKPSLVVVAPPPAAGKGGCATGYVSWNGATDVEAWVVRVGDSASEVVAVGEVRHAGFETGFVVGGRCVQVVARVAGDVRWDARSDVVCV